MEKIIGVQEGIDNPTKFIVDVGEGNAYIVDIEKKLKSHIKPLTVILKFGYWTKYEGSMKPEAFKKYGLFKT